jgi:riboflavin biosynthesis pyrimidine reductase
VTRLRLLLPGAADVGELTGSDDDVLQALADLYAYPTPLPDRGWVRASMVSTLDGSAAGADGLSGSISGAADRAVFRVLRGVADVVLVGAGTVRREGYRAPTANSDFADRRVRAGQAPAPLLAVVTRSGDLDAGTGLLDGPSPVLVVTTAGADLDRLRSRVGTDRVVVAGEHDVDPGTAVAELAGRGLRRILLEGGPGLLGQVIAARRVDEMCLTVSPHLVAGEGPRIAHGPGGDLDLRLSHLVEADGLLLGRWTVRR